MVHRVVAAFHRQREIEARRALRRYRHLLEVEQHTSHSTEISPMGSEEDISDNANEFDARERATSRRTFERA
ncbi:hypothetical protein [Bradyrhizobium sp.]|uniref:hypothetical protein n=1 Tax=Bradyrhizobium sp. TaxID=376 RepID=UPI0039E2EF52